MAAVPLLLGLIGGCSTQQMIRSETIAVMDTVAWSPDGKQIAAGRNIFNVIFLHDSADLRRTAVLSSEQQDTWGRIRARSISYSADGRYLAVAANDQPVVIWDVKSNTEALRLDGLHDARLLAFSPKDNILAVAGPENTLTLWIIPQGRQLASLPHPSQVMSLAFSVDGQLLATGGADHDARIWRLADFTLAAQLLRHDYAVTSVAFSPDSDKLISVGTKLILWDPLTGRQLAEH